MKKDYSDVRFRMVIRYKDGTYAGTMISKEMINLKKNDNQIVAIEMDTTHIMKGYYRVSIAAVTNDEFGNEKVIDGVYPGFFIELTEKVSKEQPIMWLNQYFGHVRLHDLSLQIK